jgi:Zn finger protein HypA/HybF involved in hydrogenase expression
MAFYKVKWDTTKLPDAVKNSYSVDEVLRILEIKRTGGNRETVKRYIKHMELDTSHFLGQGHRKGSSKPVFEEIPLEEILVKNSSYTNTHRLKIKLIKNGLKENRCESCKKRKWLEQPIPLELHHKNGIRDDNRIKNLILVCPNCHALTLIITKQKQLKKIELYKRNLINEIG